MFPVARRDTETTRTRRFVSTCAYLLKLCMYVAATSRSTTVYTTVMGDGRVHEIIGVGSLCDGESIVCEWMKVLHSIMCGTVKPVRHGVAVIIEGL